MDGLPPTERAERIPMTTFTDLGLAAPILKALDGEGYSTPTPIQEQAIPSVREGNDLLGIAQTGTGKTAAFALPILHRLNGNQQRPPRKGCRVLVLSPTRELASQIAQSFKVYGHFVAVSVATVFGGVGYNPQIRALSKGVDVLIATPGRLIDLIDQGHAELGGTEIFVLDEADQMLDLGFLKPIKRIASQLSSRRQTLFFSATMPKEIAGLANAFLKDPVKVTVTPAATTVERIAQKVIHVDKQRKIALLGETLSGDGIHRALVFTRTKRGADKVAKHLTAMDFTASAIHGNKSQSQRERALDGFKKSKVQILVATDIAARGIDVDAVSMVVNYDLPEVPEAYVHRIGRTARAGASGIAISFCAADDKHLLRQIERVTRQRIDSEDRQGDDTLVAASDGQKDRKTRAEVERSRRGGRGAPKNVSRNHRGGGTRRDARSGDRSRHGQSEQHDTAATATSQAGRYNPAAAKLDGGAAASTESKGRPKKKRDAHRDGSSASDTRGQAASARPQIDGRPPRKKRRKPAAAGTVAPSASKPRSKSGQRPAQGKGAGKASGQNTGSGAGDGGRAPRKKTRNRRPMARA